VPPDATQAVAKLKRVAPFYDGRAYAEHFADPADARHLLEGWRKAGMY